MNNKEAMLRLVEAIRQGPPEVIGYGPQMTEAFRHGWNANADRLYSLAVEAGLIDGAVPATRWIISNSRSDSGSLESVLQENPDHEILYRD